MLEDFCCNRDYLVSLFTPVFDQKGKRVVPHSQIYYGWLENIYFIFHT
jgi:hypothetical protein